MMEIKTVYTAELYIPIKTQKNSDCINIKVRSFPPQLDTWVTNLLLDLKLYLNDKGYMGCLKKSKICLHPHLMQHEYQVCIVNCLFC